MTVISDRVVRFQPKVGAKAMQKRIVGIALSAMLLAFSFPAEAQQPKKIPRIGFVLGSDGSDPRFEAFRQGLRDLGYNEGKNLLIELQDSVHEICDPPVAVREVRPVGHEPTGIYSFSALIHRRQPAL